MTPEFIGEYFKVGPIPLKTALTKIYPVSPTCKGVWIECVRINNTTGAGHQVSVCLVDAGGAAGQTNAWLWEKNLGAKDSEDVAKEVWIGAGTEIWAKTADGDDNCNIFICGLVGKGYRR